jgi:hypothetical protein
MAKATLNKVDPVPVPPPTITLELSLDEARLVYAAIGRIHGEVCTAMGLARSQGGDCASYAIYSALGPELSGAGVSNVQKDKDSNILTNKMSW